MWEGGGGCMFVCLPKCYCCVRKKYCRKMKIFVTDSVCVFTDPYKLFGQLTSRLCSTGKLCKNTLFVQLFCCIIETDLLRQFDESVH